MGSIKLQSDGCYWWRRLVNAFEMKAGMVCLQCKNCVIHIHERFRGELRTMGRYTNLRTFYLLTYLLTYWRRVAAWDMMTLAWAARGSWSGSRSSCCCSVASGISHTHAGFPRITTTNSWNTSCTRKKTSKCPLHCDGTTRWENHGEML